MPPAASLDDAASDAPANLAVLWQADTLKTKMIAFWQQIQPLFNEQAINDHPFIDWIAVIAAFSPSILDYDTSNLNGSPADTLTTYAQAVDYIYRICRLGALSSTITPTQDTGMLAAYNAQFT